MKKKMLGVLMGIMMAVSVIGVMGMPVSAGAIKETPSTECETRLFGLRPWYSGLSVKSPYGSCVIGTPDNMPLFVWTIILNILADLFMALGILATAYMFYGGIKYIMSQGEPGKMAAAKLILARAAVGVGIALLAGLLTNTVISVLQGAMS